MHRADRVTRGNGCLEGFLAKQRARKADELIPDHYRSGRILDIGCGTFPLFLTQTEFSEKYGIDQVVDVGSLRGLETAGITLAKWDYDRESEIPYGDEFFDVVTMLAVFEHIEPFHLPGLMENIHRILKADGMLVLTTPAWWTKGLIRFLASLNLISSEEIKEHKGSYRISEIRSILFESGFGVGSVDGGYFEMGLNTWVRARKV